ncbi:helix-turn-helix transcriptional regulator [Hyphococcus sp.]|uniref:helix-turn-helix transcriptional regulator n=1 Tax=Hyphococcus sp. TaxID=2038636 RepID=UPI003CCB9D5A
MARAVINHLRELRARKKWSQAELAKAVNVSRQAINTIENGKHDPSITLAYRIAAALDATITEAFVFTPEER